MHDICYTDDQANTFTDDKDQCDCTRALTQVISLCASTTQTSWVIVFNLKARGRCIVYTETESALL